MFACVSLNRKMVREKFIFHGYKRRKKNENESRTKITIKKRGKGSSRDKEWIAIVVYGPTTVK